METTFIVLQIVIGIALVITITLQSRGSQVGMAFGGGSYRSKRGIEKLLYYATIVLAILFASISILSLLFS